MIRFMFLFMIVLAGTAAAYGPTLGDGTAANPYQLGGSDGEIFQLVASPEDWDKHFIMTEDISLRLWTFNVAGGSIGNGPAFTGEFDGGGHVIRYITQGPCLFGHIGEDGVIRNLGLENIDVSVCALDYSTLSMGGLCQINDGRITDCYVTGKINAGCRQSPIYLPTAITGGLCGWNTGRLTRCYTHVEVYGASATDHDYTGGLCGYNEGRIVDCYACCAVWGECADGVNDNCVGGICGGNSGAVTNCYYYNTYEDYFDISPVYWLNDYGTQLTNDQMKQPSSFVRWDFDQHWVMLPGQTYPLYRQYNRADVNFDRTVDLDDLVVFAQNWLKTTE